MQLAFSWNDQMICNIFAIMEVILLYLLHFYLCNVLSCNNQVRVKIAALSTLFQFQMMNFMINNLSSYSLIINQVHLGYNLLMTKMTGRSHHARINFYM